MKTVSIAALLIAAGVGGYYFNDVFPSEDPEPPARTDLPIGTPIATSGEWVTNPDGTKVCRLVRDIGVGMTMSLGSCADWVGAVPVNKQIVPWLRNNRGVGQINVEGKWRP